MKKYTQQWLARNYLTEGWHEKKLEWLEKAITESEANLIKVILPIYYLEAVYPVLAKYKFTSTPGFPGTNVYIDIFKT